MTTIHTHLVGSPRDKVYSQPLLAVTSLDFDGGSVVAASTLPHIVPVPYSNASAADPEEAFVATVSSCHMPWFLSLATKQGWGI
jgi:organic hydroperoxide reductase OsmC/OhrA